MCCAQTAAPEGAKKIVGENECGLNAIYKTYWSNTSRHAAYTPHNDEHRLFSAEALQDKRKQWLRMHDQQTGAKMYEKSSLGTSESLPGRPWNPPKSNPGPSWAAFGSQEAPKSAHETPKQRPRGAQERPRGAQERPRAAQEMPGSTPNPYKIEPGGTQDEILARSS